MRPNFLDKLAGVLVGRCTKVRPGDLVTVVAEPESLPAVEAVFKCVLAAGGHPSFHARSERLREVVLRHGSDEQLGHVCPFEAFRLERCDVLIVLRWPVAATPAAGPMRGAIDPARLAMLEAARRGLMVGSMRRAAEGKMRYVLTELASPAGAEAAGMALAAYEDFVLRAGLLDRPDPIAAWDELAERQERMIESLRGRKTMRFRTPGGNGCGATDVTVDVEAMGWVNAAGAENFPDGEVFTGPRSGGVDGVVCFNMPATYRGTTVEGVRLVFRGGRVVDASAAVGELHLHAMLGMDEGARVVGELGIGTNGAITRGTGNAFFDEKIGGTFHLALGAGYPQTGNANESGLHWDLVHDLRAGGTIEADGEVVQRDGRFVRAGWPEV